MFESKKIYDDKLPSWIQQYVTESHYKIDPKAALLAAEYLGNDLKKVANEFKKICISHPQNEVITPQIVAEHIGISKDFTVFDLQKALGEKDFVKCFRIIQHFVENPKANPSVMVISSLFTFFQKVHTSIYHQKDSNEILAKKLGLNSAYFISDYRVAAKNYTLIQVMDIIEALHKADLLSKGVGARNMNDATLYKDKLIACMPR